MKKIIIVDTMLTAGVGRGQLGGERSRCNDSNESPTGSILSTGGGSTGKTCGSERG